MILHFVGTYVSLVASVLFILALRGLSSAKTSVSGNRFGMVGMTLALIGTQVPVYFENLDISLTSALMKVLVVAVLGGLIGYVIAKKINMTALPQLLAGFHSLVGMGAVFIALASFFLTYGMTSANHDVMHVLELVLGATIGAITFTGSVVAFGKLQGIISGKPWRFKGQRQINVILGLCLIGLMFAFLIKQTPELLIYAVILSLIIGYMLIMPIGGADMPVVISMLNSYSGWATSGIGFSASNELLVIVGALVGTSGAILSHIMCKGMNRSLVKVIFGSFGSQNKITNSQNDQMHRNVKLCSPEDAGFILQNANSVIIVPGYGMAVAQAQHVIKELADELKSEDISVKYAIHPVAGRMPGHMNVLLAEANIPYEDVFELEDINNEFGQTDVAIVIGANDITNPAAKEDPASPIYGMPVLDVEKAKTVLFIKRSLGSGYAGIENQLFYRENTMMILGDAKKVCDNLTKVLKNR